MKKRITINIEGQSKAIVGSVKIDYELETTQESQTFINRDHLKETQELYEEVEKYCDLKTKQKVIR